MISDPVKNFETQFPIQRKSVGPTATASSRKIQVPTRYVCTEEQKYRGYQTWAYSFVGGAKGLSALFSQKGVRRTPLVAPFHSYLTVFLNFFILLAILFFQFEDG